MSYQCPCNTNGCDNPGCTNYPTDPKERMTEIRESVGRYRSGLDQNGDALPPSHLQDARHALSARFHEILAELGELHDTKQKDYGADHDPFANVRNSQDFGVPAWVGSAMRANDKMKRIQAFARRGSLMNESLEDSLRDLAVYAVIALVLLEEES